MNILLSLVLVLAAVTASGQQSGNRTANKFAGSFYGDGGGLSNITATATNVAFPNNLVTNNNGFATNLSVSQDLKIIAPGNNGILWYSTNGGYQASFYELSDAIQGKLVVDCSFMSIACGNNGILQLGNSSLRGDVVKVQYDGLAGAGANRPSKNFSLVSSIWNGTSAYVQDYTWQAIVPGSSNNAAPFLTLSLANDEFGSGAQRILTINTQTLQSAATIDAPFYKSQGNPVLMYNTNAGILQLQQATYLTNSLSLSAPNDSFLVYFSAQAIGNNGLVYFGYDRQCDVRFLDNTSANTDAHTYFRTGGGAGGSYFNKGGLAVGKGAIASTYTLEVAGTSQDLFHYLMPTNAPAATPSGNDGYLWNSNKVLYWVTATQTKLVVDGR